MDRNRTPARLVHALRAGCALLLACAGDDGAGDPLAPVDLWPVPSEGHPYRYPAIDAGRTIEPPPRGPTDWPPPDPVEPGTDAGDDDAGPPMEPDPALALFDPEEVYLFGSLSAGTSLSAVAPVLAPNDALVGYYPGDPKANDELVLPACDDPRSVDRFTVTAAGATLIQWSRR